MFLGIARVMIIWIMCMAMGMVRITPVIIPGHHIDHIHLVSMPYTVP